MSFLVGSLWSCSHPPFCEYSLHAGLGSYADVVHQFSCAFYSCAFYPLYESLGTPLGRKSTRSQHIRSFTTLSPASADQSTPQESITAIITPRDLSWWESAPTLAADN